MTYIVRVVSNTHTATHMKLIKIGTKAEANRTLVESLFSPVNGRTLRKERFDSGKYKADGAYVGREVEAPERVHAIWAEKRKDSDGAYACLFCLVAE